jgi:protein disulfide-isomerase
MRISWLLPLLSLASPILAIPKDAAPKPAAATDAADADTGPKSTKFNGQEVPPFRELSGETINEDIKQGYWYASAFIRIVCIVYALSADTPQVR